MQEGTGSTVKKLKFSPQREEILIFQPGKPLTAMLAFLDLQFDRSPALRW